MRAAILYGREDVRIEHVAPPALKPGEVRLRIEAALTCGTDLKVFKRGYHAKMIVPPAVFGHELAGVVTEVNQPGTVATAGPSQGARSTRELLRRTASHLDSVRGSSRFNGNFACSGDWQVGDRVVVANSAPCGHCYFCRRRQENLCDDLLFLNGAYAQSIVVPERLAQKNMLRLAPHTEFADAALVEPLACVVQGIEEAQLHPGDEVLVIGAGPIGLMFAALGRHLGCHMTVAGRGENRLETARRLGAEQVFAVPRGADLVTLLAAAKAASAKPALPKHGFDVVIEAVGKPDSWQAAVQLVRKGGTVNFFGGCPSGTSAAFDTELLHYSSLTLLASFHHSPGTVRRALEFIESGIIQAADFVDGECALSSLPALFKSMAVGNHAVKTLIRVNN